MDIRVTVMTLIVRRCRLTGTEPRLISSKITNYGWCMNCRWRFGDFIQGQGGLHAITVRNIHIPARGCH